MQQQERCKTANECLENHLNFYLKRLGKRFLYFRELFYEFDYLS